MGNFTDVLMINCVIWFQKAMLSYQAMRSIVMSGNLIISDRMLMVIKSKDTPFR